MRKAYAPHRIDAALAPSAQTAKQDHIALEASPFQNHANAFNPLFAKRTLDALKDRGAKGRT
jgi:hypothetical protein